MPLTAASTCLNRRDDTAIRSEPRNELFVDNRTISRFRAAADLAPTSQPVFCKLLKRDGRWTRVRSLIDGSRTSFNRACAAVRYLNLPSDCWLPAGSR